MIPFASLLIASFVIVTLSRTSKGTNDITNATSSLKAVSTLSEILSSTYGNDGVSGILDLCQNTNMTKAYSPHDLVQAALNVPHKGIASGVLNAIIGSCCLDGTTNGTRKEAGLALDLFRAYDIEGRTMTPDIVTLAVTYTATFQRYPAIANQILSRSKELITTRSDEKLTLASQHVTTHSDQQTMQVLLDHSGYAIINKPSGIAVFNSDALKSAHLRRNNKRTVPSMEDTLLKQGSIFNELSSLNPDGSKGLVHRLDRGTSGCLLIAKSNPWHARLMTQFFLRRVKKSYIALLYTNGTSLADEGQINLRIDGRPAQSSFVVLERYGKLAAKVKVTTRQGRKHQVRIHCSRGLQAPILLDPLYGGEAIMYHLLDDSVAKTCRARQQFCLHADTVSIPDLGIYDIQAPLPDWWQYIVEEVHRSQK